MMSESKITATKVARLGVLVLALLAALVAVQAFGAKPAEALCAAPGPPQERTLSPRHRN